MKKILLAGATGYLGSFILQELQKRKYPVRALVRDSRKIQATSDSDVEIFEGEITLPESITGCCNTIDVVISTVGITRQKEGLSYMDVDYQANVTLLREAQRAGVSKFVYVSVLNAEEFANLSICRAKGLFVEQLKRSGLDYCIIRPNGFFSDMAEFFAMAERGRAYLFGRGQHKSNPIHGADLATFCVDAVDLQNNEFDIGGPETLSHNDIAKIAFNSLQKEPKIYYVPELLRKFTLYFLRSCTGRNFYGPIEFFLTVMATDMVAPEYGSRTLKDFFASLASQKS